MWTDDCGSEEAVVVVAAVGWEYVTVNDEMG